MHQPHYFLREDFEALNDQIEDLNKKIREIGKDMGESCSEGAETFHDNFAHEEGTRQLHMWTKHLRHLIRIREEARPIDPSQTAKNKVTIGKIVTFRDLETNQVQTVKIGSYLLFSIEDNVLSYNSPLVRLILRAEVGDVREGVAGERWRKLLIEDIQQS